MTHFKNKRLRPEKVTTLPEGSYVYVIEDKHHWYLDLLGYNGFKTVKTNDPDCIKQLISRESYRQIALCHPCYLLTKEEAFLEMI